MHEIEPYYGWRDYYIAEEDPLSPFFETEHNEFEYTNTIYNYYIHPQWDYFGSSTMYMKVLCADYEQQFAVIEFIGEWNDAITNDIMILKRDIIEPMLKEGIVRFILIGENVLNFHASDDCYYEEWFDDIKDEGGWVALINFRKQVIDEMRSNNIFYYLSTGEKLNTLLWRKLKPRDLHFTVDSMILKALT
jgi:hypothetical protein